MKKELHFIGTSHLDPEGYERLTHLLRELRPATILLEVSPFSLLFRKTFGRLYLWLLHRHIRRLRLPRSAETGLIESYLGLPYEYAASRTWRRESGARLRLVDVSLFSLFRLIHAHRLISPGNLRTLSEIGTDRFSMEKKIAAAIFGGDRDLSGMKLGAFAKDGLLIRREGILYHRVTKQVARSAPGGIVYIGGWEHMIDDERKITLFSMINGPKIRRIAFLE